MLKTPGRRGYPGMPAKKQETTERQPTVEDVNAIGNTAAQAATETAESGGTADEAGEAAANAARDEAERREIHLPDAVIQQIGRASAAATVAELSKQGAIGAPEPPAAQHDDEDDDDDGGKPEGEPDPEPHKRTLAERMLSAYSR